MTTMPISFPRFRKLQSALLLAGIGFASLSAPAAPLFTQLPASSTGVQFNQPIDTTHPMRRLYNSSLCAGGIAIGDLNGDERLDLLLTSGPRANQVYFQQSDWQFTPTTLGNASNTWSTGAAMADIDNDGDLDLYICNYDLPNELWLNDGQGNFTEAAAAHGLDLADASLMPYFYDYDKQNIKDMKL